MERNDTVKNIDVAITAYLRRSGRTQADVAEAIGVSAPTLNRKMLGHAEWKLGELISLRRYMGVSMSELLGEE